MEEPHGSFGRKRSPPCSLERSSSKKSLTGDASSGFDASTSVMETAVARSPEAETIQDVGDVLPTSEPVGALSGREKLLQFRMSVAGNVSIPDNWHGERNLREWVEWNSVDKALRPNGLLRARDSLVNEQKDFQDKKKTRPLQDCNRTSIDVYS